MIILLCTISFLIGALAGAYGFYCYANHMYRKHPDLFMQRLERKIQRWRASESEQ